MLWIADGPLIVGGSQVAEDICRPHLPRAYQTKGDALDFVRSMWEMGGGGDGTKKAGQGVAPGEDMSKSYRFCSSLGRVFLLELLTYCLPLTPHPLFFCHFPFFLISRDRDHQSLEYIPLDLSTLTQTVP
jgi:hypothetical protein